MTAPTTPETADHAELAACPFCGGEAKSETLGHGKSARTGVKCADVDCPGSMRLVGPDEDGVAFWNRRPRESALLSEIAALRGDLTETRVAADLLASSLRADLRQAERQRDELRKALERIADEAPYRSGYCQSDVEYGPALSADEMQAVARQALANQGAE